MMRAVKAYPALLRAGFAAAVAYRAELFIWMFATNMPLVMLALWSAVAREGVVIGGAATYTRHGFAAYYVSTLFVRLLTGAWVVWELTMEIRNGSLALRLLRPLHPLVAYSAENLAAVPLRAALALPVLGVLLWVERAQLGHALLPWMLLPPALLGAWLLTFFVMAMVGTLALWLESATGIFDAWMGLSAVLSGYLIPLDLFPPAVRQIAQALPFRFLISFPVELMLGRLGAGAALSLLLLQWSYVGLAGCGALLLWRAGMRRFAAYGG